MPLVGLLLVEVALRARYPWDLLMWSESPFMTNLLKLHGGEPVYSPPGDVSSFVYSPGLEYVTYALLAPVGRVLDVRFCRLVNIAIGFGAAAVAAIIAIRVARTLAGARSGRTFGALLCGAILVVFRNFTADVLHPDNIQMLHATLTLLLSLEAAASRRFALALAAVGFAAVGVWTKQVEVLAVVGAAIAVLANARWSSARALAIVATGAVVTAVAVAVLLASPYARFHLLDLLLEQAWHRPMGLPKLVAAVEPFFFGHRLLLLALAVDAIRRLWRAGGEPGRRFVVAWAAVGVTTAVPCLSAYLKPMGTWNNLGLLDLWMFLPVAIVLATRATTPVGPEFRLRRALVVAFVLALCPMKLPPTAAMYAYGEALDGAIQADVAAGRRVLLGHGTMPLIRAGATAVPRDRANTTLELLAAGRTAELRPMVRRFHDGFYDRIYLNSNWYDGMTLAISERYRETGAIEQAGWLPTFPWSFVLLTGHDRLLTRVAIYTPK